MNPKDIMPPTDNLYKFVALFGLTLVLASLLFMAWRMDTIFEESAGTNAEVALVNSMNTRQGKALEAAKGELKALKDEIRALDREVGNGNLSPARRKEISERKPENERRQAEVQHECSAANSADAAINTKIDEINSHARSINDHLTTFGFLAKIVGVIVGIGMIIAGLGFHSWYRKLQAPQDRLLQLELFAEEAKAADREKRIADSEPPP